MAKEVTIIGKDSGVSLGLLEKTGRRYYYIYFVAPDLLGGTIASSQITKALKDSVELMDGYRYDIFVSRLVLVSQGMLG